MGLPRVTSNCLIMKPNKWPFSHPLPYLQPSALVTVLYSSGSTDLLDFRSPAISTFSLHIVVHETCLQPSYFSYSSFFPFCSFAPQSAFILSYPTVSLSFSHTICWRSLPGNTYHCLKHYPCGTTIHVYPIPC